MRGDLRDRFRLLIAMGTIGALLVSLSIFGTLAAHRSANRNGELLRIIKPLVTPTNLDAAKQRQACLVLLAADKPVDEGCAKIRDELVRIQAGGR